MIHADLLSGPIKPISSSVEWIAGPSMFCYFTSIILNPRNVYFHDYEHHLMEIECSFEYVYLELWYILVVFPQLIQVVMIIFR